MAICHKVAPLVYYVPFSFLFFSFFTLVMSHKPNPVDTIHFYSHHALNVKKVIINFNTDYG